MLCSSNTNERQKSFVCFFNHINTVRRQINGENQMLTHGVVLSLKWGISTETVSFSHCSMLLHRNAFNNETSSHDCGGLVIQTRDSMDGKFHANAKLVVNRLLKALYMDQTVGPMIIPYLPLLAGGMIRTSPFHRFWSFRILLVFFLKNNRIRTISCTQWTRGMFDAV